MKFTQSFQNVCERVGRVRVIDEHLKLSLRRDQFKPSGNLRRLRKTQHRASQVNSQGVGGSERRDRVCYVKTANQWEPNEVTLTAHIKLVRCSGELCPII